MKHLKEPKFSLAAMAAALVTSSAFAQSSVTLYGAVDNGIGYQSSQTSVGSTTGGHSVVKMNNGIWYGSRFGLLGKEDLGGGTNAIFQLEEGINSATGAEASTGLMFSRQAYVGLTNPTYGSITAGRQYTAYLQLLSAFGPANWLGGAYGAHPGDIDELDTIYRINNSLVYSSPSFHGLTLGGSYAFGGAPGSINSGSTWSLAAQYKNGPAGLAVGFMRLNNSAVGGGPWGAYSTASNAGAQTAVSAVNAGYQYAQAQQRLAVTGGYTFSSQWDISASYSNVQYIPGINSKFTSTAVFNTVGTVLHFRPVVTWDLAAGYSYTRATEANGITHAASYNQFNLTEYYSLSKRTGLYALEAYQRANGNTVALGGGIIRATATIGDYQNGAPSSSASQFVAGVGIVHKF